MPDHLLHRFVIEAKSQHHWVALHQEQMDAVLAAERRVVEGIPRRVGTATAFVWWYFNDSGSSLLRVEMGTDADRADVVWEGRIHDAYVGRLCSVLLL